MKLKFSIIIIILTFISLTSWAQPNKKVAVLNPVCRDNSVPSLYYTIVRGSFESVVSATHGYEAFDRSALDAIIQEHDLERSGLFDESQIKSLGKFAGVDYVLVTEISAAEGYLMVVAKILNVETTKYDRAVDGLMVLTPPKVKNDCTELAQKLFGINMTTKVQTGEIEYNGNRYVGEYKNGKPHGKGKLFFSDKTLVSYEGQFVDGVIQGFGKLIAKNGEWYEGNFVEYEMNGKGTYHWPDGRKYVGEFLNGEMNGKGIMYYPDGAKYDGNWNRDAKHGKGVYYFPSGEHLSRLEGVWKDGRKNGYFIAYYSSGNCYSKGNFYNDKEEGTWYMFNMSGERVHTWKGKSYEVKTH